MNKLYFFIILITVSNISLLPQHLPLEIGNQWHYNASLAPPGIDYAAIAVDTSTINGKSYYKIERRHAYTGELLTTTYDRLEGDSAYYRFSNNEESLIINFNWPVGYTRVTTTDSVCFDFNVLSWIGMRNVWGFNTESYHFQIGFWCVGMQDTTWLLFSPEIVREFGCYLADDGSLVGALINGVVYGTLYPLPVELTSFSAFADNNDVQLNWITATETNNQGFEIQKKKSEFRSQETECEMIGFVDGNGTTTEKQTYSFADKNISAGKYQYRLKQIDFDGTFEYSNIIEVEVGIPREFSLSQNYPNPFNPTTKIKFTLLNTDNPLPGGARGGLVTLKIYDVLGNEIATLINEEKPAGSYEVEFDATGLTSGIYFYQLKSGSFIQTMKMLLLK